MNKLLLTLIGKFPWHELDRLMENSSNRQFKNFGAWHRPISGKLIQSRAFSLKMTFKEFRGVTQTDSWKTRPGIWMSFPEIGLRHAPKILKLTIG